MKKPDFKELHEMLERLDALDAGLSGIFLDREIQEEQVRLVAAAALTVEAKRALSEISTEELKASRAGIRVSALQEAGFTNLGTLSAATDAQIAAVEGVGEKQTEAIRRILDEFTAQLAAKGALRMEDGVTTPENTALVTAIARYRAGEAIRKMASPLSEDLHHIAEDLKQRIRIRGPLRWLFSAKETKEETLAAAADLAAFLQSARAFEALQRIDDYQQKAMLSAAEAHADFEKNSADYYALLERFADVRPPAELVYSSIPAALAAEVDATPLDVTGFSGNLRAYQTFGAKYILHQRDVLLGDEMGLGKTVQAIAAMVSLWSESAGCHFLIVCPASVLVNWCREFERFSNIPAYLVHGPKIETAFAAWVENGGAAVTNFESMEKIADRIDNQMRLAMLVVDEAHYIKNPDAKRTRNIRRLGDESERILLMSGTPLENNVEEMCSLLDFVRPDLSEKARDAAFMRNAPAFREMLSPVYLRRLRESVLQELPPMEERQEWCALTPEDRLAYVRAVASESFPAVRRVSFLQEDMQTSSKALRLLELCSEAAENGRRILVYSYFRETVERVSSFLENRCFGVITGETSPAARQEMIDRFGSASAGSVLVCQIQAGGTGLNIQAASVVIFCEPQIKPSLTQQALSRVYRMGQVRNVLVFHLLCENTVDEAMCDLLAQKQLTFDLYADESAMGAASDDLADRDWIRAFLEREREKYGTEDGDTAKTEMETQNHIGEIRADRIE